MAGVGVSQMPWANNTKAYLIVLLLTATSWVSAESKLACAEVLDGKCVAGPAATGADEADAMAADFIQRSAVAESDETNPAQPGLLKNWLTAEAKYLGLFSESTAAVVNEAKDLKVTHESLASHSGNDPSVVVPDGKSQPAATGHDVKEGLLHDLLLTREELRQKFGAKDPSIAALDSKIHLLRGDQEASVRPQRDIKAKDGKQEFMIDKRQQLDDFQDGVKEETKEKDKSETTKDGKHRDEQEDKDEKNNALADVTVKTKTTKHDKREDKNGDKKEDDDAMAHEALTGKTAEDKDDERQDQLAGMSTDDAKTHVNKTVDEEHQDPRNKTSDDLSMLVDQIDSINQAASQHVQEAKNLAANLTSSAESAPQTEEAKTSELMSEDFDKGAPVDAFESETDGGDPHLQDKDGTEMAQESEHGEGSVEEGTKGKRGGSEEEDVEGKNGGKEKEEAAKDATELEAGEDSFKEDAEGKHGGSEEEDVEGKHGVSEKEAATNTTEIEEGEDSVEEDAGAAMAEGEDSVEKDAGAAVAEVTTASKKKDEEDEEENEEEELGQVEPKGEAQEMFDMLTSNFNHLDRDQDKYLDEKELRNSGGSASVPSFDTDHNTKISLKEYIEGSLTEMGY